MSEPQHPPPPTDHQELLAGELLRRAQPLPAYGEMVIEDLDGEEAEAFLTAVLQEGQTMISGGDEAGSRTFGDIGPASLQ